MKISKTTKWIAGSVLGVIALLFLTLIVHILLVTPKNYDNNNLQLSRIDFKEPIDSAKAKTINSQLRSVDGIKNTHINLKDGILVYSYDVNKVNADQAFEALIQKGNYKATRFVVTDEMKATGCPIMDRNSFSYRFSNGVQKIFN